MITLKAGLMFGPMRARTFSALSQPLIMYRAKRFRQSMFTLQILSALAYRASCSY